MMPLQEEMEKEGNWLFRYRGTLPLIILFVGFVLYIQSQTNPLTNNSYYKFYYEYFCLAVSMFGLAIRVYTVGYTPANTSGRNKENQLADSLNTAGIYSLVRHPLYLGNFFMWLGPALLTENLWFVVAFTFLYCLYYERIMLAEERFLRCKFGDGYTAWAERVPAIIPSLNFDTFKKPALPFSWKKVFRQEKNGLFATFLIFAVFNVSGELINGERGFNSGLIILSVLAAVFYIITKYLKKYTRILHEDGR
ncbi:MAG: isoprenylcysteine carboxylmethyltransferase family protein [Niabella sp.]